MEYTLTDQERAAVTKLRTQLSEAEGVIEQARKVVEQKQAEVIACRGAIQGVTLMLKAQQGWDADAAVEFDDEFGKLTGKG
jgi:hypothetical protein